MESTLLTRTVRTGSDTTTARLESCGTNARCRWAGCQRDLTTFARFPRFFPFPFLSQRVPHHEASWLRFRIHKVTFQYKLGRLATRNSSQSACVLKTINLRPPDWLG